MSITRVAKLAGVSSSTVSRVINNHPRVAPETAEAVRKAMAKIGYTPSENRPGPKPSSRSRSGAIHVMFLVFGSSRGRSAPGFEELVHGISTAAERNNVEFTFSYVPDVDAFTQRLGSQKVDGVLLGGNPGASARAKLANVPCVWLMGNRRRPDWGDQVMPDSYSVGELAARYLHGRGHQNVAFLNLDEGHWAIHLYGHAFSVAMGELGGTVTLLEERRAQIPEGWAEPSQESVERLVKRFVELTPRPTGIFVAEDMQVAMLQPALQRAGVTIGPEGTEVVSVNNERPYLTGLSPMPVSIDIRVGAIGSRGLEQLLWRIERPGSHDRVVTMLEPRLPGN